MTAVYTTVFITVHILAQICQHINSCSQLLTNQQVELQWVS